MNYIALFPDFSTFSVLRFLLNNTQKWKNGTKKIERERKGRPGKLKWEHLSHDVDMRWSWGGGGVPN